MADVSFSTEMLDGFDHLYRRTEDTLKSVTEIAAFYRKLSVLERQYGSDLIKLAKRYGGSKVTDKELGSLRKGWDCMQQELENVGNKHFTFSDSITNELFGPLTAYVKKKEADRKKLMADGMKLTKDFKTALANLDIAKKKYQEASKAADAAAGAYSKAKSESTVKPKELNKLNGKASKAADVAHSADKDYQKLLEKTNVKQTEFYQRDMPDLLKKFQEFEEERIEYLKQHFLRYSTFCLQFPSLLEFSGKSVQKSFEEITVPGDIQAFLDANKTGISAPPPIQYEPYGMQNTEFQQAASLAPSPTMTSTPSSVSSGVARGPAPTPGSSSSSGSGPGNNIVETSIPIQKEASVPKDYGLAGMLAALPDDVKLEKLKQQLKDVKDGIRQERKTAKGLEKLIKFYASDPTAQEKTQGELNERKDRIAELRNVQASLEADIATLKPAAEPEADTFGGAEEGGHDESVAEAQTAGDDEWEAGEVVDTPGETGEGEGEEEEELVVLVKAECLYSYVATNTTELSFKEGDILSVTDQDDSGWWFAELNGASGFVPNNYLKVIE